MTNFCADIHNNLAIVLTPQGVKVSACCWENSGKTINSVNNIWNASNLLHLRDLNKQDKLDKDACKQCIYMEKHGDKSRRLGVNQYYNSTATDLPGPRGLEIKIDFTCNIACVYCGPYNSTQWRLELDTPKKQFPIRLAQHDIVKILDELDLSNLDNIHFYGGDPLFTNTHEFILNYVKQRVGLEKIYVWYNTNGTLRVSQRVQDIWSQCRLVKVFFSIDDVGPRFEYIRYGAVWNEVADNMLWYKDTMPGNVMFTIQPTMSCLNSLHHYELIQWKDQYLATNRQGDLTDLTRHNVFKTFELNSMPDKLKYKVVELNSQDSWFARYVQSFEHSVFKQKQTQQLIKQLDERRGCNFAATFPDLVEYFVK
jgi:MoaA/NifB/PqqE/SkfB family radical SAM enzyme